MNKRAFILNTFIFITFIAIFFRLFNLMVFKHEGYFKRLESQKKVKVDIQARRGFIFDKNGKRLAVNLEYDSIYFYKDKLKTDDEVLYHISKIVGVKHKNIVSKLKTKKSFVWLKRKVPNDVSEKIKKLNVEGLGIIPDLKRYYPMGTIASHIIGFVDIDNKGLEGVELKYDNELMTKGEKISVLKDARGNRFYNDYKSEKRGSSLVLTLDRGLQYIVEKEIDLAVKKWKAESATVIMMDPYTGEIMALANRPTYDPNKPSSFRIESRRNRAITDIFEPGSTFKIVTAAAALEENKVRINEVFDCTKGYIEVGGKRIRDAHKHEDLTFMEVIQKSSNIGTVMIAQRLGKEILYKYSKKFGFDNITGIDLAGEIAGWVREPSRWSGVSIGSVAIGQEVAVTALQVLNAYATVANGGYRITPYVVKGILTPEGFTIENNNDISAERVFSEKTIAILKDALIMAAGDEGTAQFATVEGNKVAGKTGTAQMIDKKTRRYSHKDFVSSFVGFAPADKPAFVMIIVLWKPRGQIYGGIVAAPTFRNIAEKSLMYLNIPREDRLDKNMIVASSKRAHDYKGYYAGN